MIAARRVVEEKTYAETLGSRAELMIERMRASPLLSCESYPNECWMFCNTVALAAIKMHDVLDRADHAAFVQEWLAMSEAHLVDPETGLLIRHTPTTDIRWTARKDRRFGWRRTVCNWWTTHSRRISMHGRARNCGARSWGSRGRGNGLCPGEGRWTWIRVP